MSTEQILLSGITGVTTALVFLFRLLWTRSEECEVDRRALRKEIEEVKATAGIAAGTLKAFEKCPEQECPFKAAKITGISIISGILAFAITGCAQMDHYDRTYSFQYGEGANAARVGITLQPRTLKDK